MSVIIVLAVTIIYKCFTICFCLSCCFCSFCFNKPCKMRVIIVLAVTIIYKCFTILHVSRYFKITFKYHMHGDIVSKVTSFVSFMYVNLSPK